MGRTGTSRRNKHDGNTTKLETLSSTYTDANKNPLNTTMPHPTSPLLYQAWIEPQSLTQCQVKKPHNSMPGFFSREVLPSSSPGHFHFYFDEQYYPLKTGNKSDRTENKTAGKHCQGSLWPPHFVLLTLPTCNSREMETPLAGRSTGRHALTSPPCGSWLKESLLIINPTAISETPCHSHFIQSFILEAKWRYVTTPN